MDRPDYLNEIRNRIKAEKYGSVFVATDFADIAERRVGDILHRGEEERIMLKFEVGDSKHRWFYCIGPSTGSGTLGR